MAAAAAKCRKDQGELVVSRSAISGFDPPRNRDVRTQSDVARALLLDGFNDLAADNRPLGWNH